MSGFNDKEWYEKNVVSPMVEEEQDILRGKPLKKSKKKKLRKEQGKRLITNRPGGK